MADHDEEILMGPQENPPFRSAAEMSFRAEQSNGSEGILEGRMLPYNEWAKIDSYIEGRFYERFLPRSFSKNIRERGDKIRILFEHGMSKLLDKQPIAKLEELEEREDGLHYRARLLPGLPPLFVEGLREGLYGSSVRHNPIKQTSRRFPMRSEYNPDGWEERSVSEASMLEFSVVTFPAYAGSTASIRSLTDKFMARSVAAWANEHPELVLEHLRSQATEVEPPHSEPAPDQEDPDGDTGSRDTQPEEETEPAKPAKDWLAPTERKEGWLP